MHKAAPTDDAADTRRLQLLESLGLTLAGKRQAAINHRGNSGIEQIWIEDEEHYDGIDDANRASETGSTVEKPTTTGNRGKTATSEAELKSNIFPNITQPYVDAASARICDMLLPTDDRNFAIEPTPIPELADFEELVDNQFAPPDLPPAVPGTPPPGAQTIPQGGAPIMPPGSAGTSVSPPGSAGTSVSPPGAQPTAAMPPPTAPVEAPIEEERVRLPNGEVVTLSQLAEKIAETKATATRKATAAQTQIDDWLTECDYLGELRQTIDDAAKVGTGVVKGPIPLKKQRKTWKKDATGALTLTIAEVIVPASKNISYWNLYPDPACGDDIHRGSWIWEVDSLSEKSIRALKGLPGYIDTQIDAVLEEGPTKYTTAGRFPYDSKKDSKGQYQIWYFHGTVSREDIEAAGCDCGEKKDASFEALITMINDKVVRAALNPLDSGEFPYDVMRWKRRRGFWAGMGVARQMRTSQRMVTAATRNLMDNAGLGAGPMFVFGRGITPQNGVWEIKPRKIFTRTEDDDGGSQGVRADVETIVIPMLQGELTNIIQLGMKMAEDSTGLPMLLQGQQGSAPDTVGGMQILNNNGSSVLRRIARLFDNGITKPHIQRYYDWLMMYSDNEEAKGDMFIKARGSSALVERDAQTMELAQIVGMTLNPAFGKDPKKAMTEYLKSRRFDPTAFDYTKEEQRKIDAQPPAPPPPVAVAQIRAETELKKTEMVTGVQRERTAADTDRDTAYVHAEAERTAREHEGRMAELAVKERLAMLEYATQQKVSLDRVKSDLTKTVMTLRVTKELANADRKLKSSEMPKPPVEPAGRAPDGRSFAQ